MSHYECVFLMRQDISAQQAETIADEYQKLIEDAGGSVGRREHWGLKSLSYKIKKNRKAHYVLFNLEASSETLMEMERQMRLNEDVLRYLSIKTEDAITEPSAMMKSRDDRRDRRGGRDDRPRDRDDRPRDGGRDGGRDDRPPRREARDDSGKEGDSE